MENIIYVALMESTFKKIKAKPFEKILAAVSTFFNRKCEQKNVFSVPTHIKAWPLIHRQLAIASSPAFREKMVMFLEF